LSNNAQARTGLFGVGLETYWAQFTGLKEKLLGYQERVRTGIESCGAAVVDAGLVDNPAVADEIGERQLVTAGEVSAKLLEFHDTFDVAPECEETELDRAARTAVALDKLAAGHDLGSMAYYYCHG